MVRSVNHELLAQPTADEHQEYAVLWLATHASQQGGITTERDTRLMNGCLVMRPCNHRIELACLTGLDGCAGRCDCAGSCLCANQAWSTSRRWQLSDWT